MRLAYLDRKKFKPSLADDGSYFINCGGAITPKDRIELLAKAGHRCFELRTKAWFNSWGKMLSRLSNGRTVTDGRNYKYDLLTDEVVADLIATLVVQQPKNIYTYKDDPIWSIEEGKELKATLEALCKEQKEAREK